MYYPVYQNDSEQLTISGHDCTCITADPVVRMV